MPDPVSIDHPVTAVLIGAGERGLEVYGRYALSRPDLFRFVAVAEPDGSRRQRFAAEHRIDPEHCYANWEPLLAEPKLAEVAFICTPDHLHVGPGLAALEQGYHLMLEKPMAPNLADCLRLVEAAELNGNHLQLGYVLRYAPFFQAVRRAIDAGRLGEIITISQRENISYWHMAHSFVRGNWRSREESSPMILSKCSHDLDLLYWFAGAPARTIASFGNLRHFRPECAPEGAPLRCTDGCPAEVDCIYSAVDIYVRLTPLINLVKMSNEQPLKSVAAVAQRYPSLTASAARLIPPLKQITEYDGWPVRIVTNDYTREGRLNAVRDPANPYGRCVYQCDNDVVDNQHVAIEFENGVTATLIMHGHSYAEGRTLRIDGSAATLIGEMYTHRHHLVLHDKRTGRAEVLVDDGLHISTDGHGGGDGGLMREFAALIRGGDPEDASGAREALQSHLMAFAAEEARIDKKVVTIGK